VRNLFDEWRRLKSYPTNINIVYWVEAKYFVHTC
jgi:hypothetical protein